MGKTKFSVGVVLFVALGILLIGPAPWALAQNIELKLAHFMPTMHIQHREAFVPFANKVSEITGGKLTVKIYPGGTLGNPKTMVDSISKGITDIGFVLPRYVTGRFPRSSVFDLPFIFESSVHLTKVMYDLYDEYFMEDYKAFKVLWFLSSPLSQLHTIKKPVLKVADFKGMRIRTSGAIESQTVKKLGGNPVSMPISELSIALQKGVVDGAITPYAALKSFKLIDLTKHITEINLSATLMVVLMNKKKWNSLPDFAREAIDQVATREFGLKAAGAYVQEDIENIELGKTRGIQFHKLSEAEKTRLRNKISDLWQEWVKRNQKRFASQEMLDAVLASAKANR
ncbi:MAG: TRAP transporter substrate-binding protein [Deltaproteobacteria bacterium]|nr:TRAP transporter substrate-binding protein [Deltaproteobacteria bacterium]